jgi:hypothetical protein
MCNLYSITTNQAAAGIWTEFKGDRGTKSKPIPDPHLVYGFLTTAPNAVVEPIHPKAMPVILTPIKLAARRPSFRFRVGNRSREPNRHFAIFVAA